MDCRAMTTDLNTSSPLLQKVGCLAHTLVRLGHVGSDLPSPNRIVGAEDLPQVRDQGVPGSGRKAPRGAHFHALELISPEWLITDGPQDQSRHSGAQARGRGA